MSLSPIARSRPHSWPSRIANGCWPPMCACGMARSWRHFATSHSLTKSWRRHENQFDLLRSRVEQGASPPLERDLLDVELRRLQADRLIQAGRTETAVFELKRVLGMKADAALTVRDTFEDLVQRESAVAPQVADASMAVEQRADVREAAARIETAVAKIDRAESEGRFDVSLFGNYMRMDAGFPQRGFGPDGGLERVRGQFNYWSAGAMVTIPVLNRNQGELAVAQAERTGAAAAHEAVRLAAEAELASARARDERAQRGREALRRRRPGAGAPEPRGGRSEL